MLSRMLRRQVAVARLHTSAPRLNIVKDLYMSEIKAFKPKPVTEKERNEQVLQWQTPPVPKSPTVEGDTAEIDAYAKAPVDVESSEAAAETDAGGDWFPIEDESPETSH